MKAKHLFDAIGVVAAAAVVAEQAYELLAPFVKNVSVPRFVPDVIRDIPARTANAFSAFSTQPADYQQPGPRVVRSAPTQPRQHRQAPTRPRTVHPEPRLARTA